MATTSYEITWIKYLMTNLKDDWLKTEYVKSAEQVADALNKALSVASLGHDLTKIGAKNMCSPSCGGC